MTRLKMMKTTNDMDPITDYLEKQPLNRMRLLFYQILNIEPCTDPKWQELEPPDQQ